MDSSGIDAQEKAWSDIQAFLDKAAAKEDNRGWDLPALRATKLVKVASGMAEFEFTVTEQLCNPMGILHGGCASTILDILTSLATLTVPGNDGMVRALSRTLTMTFLRPVPVGTKTRIVVELVAMGRKFVHCKGSILTMDGKICVGCVHDKAVVQAANL
ncbi:hypothetical protein GX48_04888 [Paracoccidioides brasiliensis]|nr:hypothetical protein GX48_04888 [Paracoccidioides brasiliensis]